MKQVEENDPIYLNRRAVYSNISRAFAAIRSSNEINCIRFTIQNGICSGEVLFTGKLTLRTSAYISLCGCVAEAGIEARQFIARETGMTLRYVAPDEFDLDLIFEYFTRKTPIDVLDLTIGDRRRPRIDVSHWRKDFDNVRALSDQILPSLFANVRHSIEHEWTEVSVKSESVLDSMFALDSLTIRQVDVPIQRVSID